MLKLTRNIRDGIDVTKFLKLVPFLKKKKISWLSSEKVLTRDQVNLFLEKASDENYLLWKVNIKFCYDKLYNLPFFYGHIMSHAKRRTNQNVELLLSPIQSL
jgi:hypothetical protein